MSPHEPVLPGMGVTGSGASGAGAPDPRLLPLAALLLRAIGEEPLALLAGGSHATGEAAWAHEGGRARSLSDLDAWWIAPDEAARSRAIVRWRAAAHAVARDARALGFDAPIELSVLTPEGLARLPAKPGTIELREGGVVLAGDPAWRERVPAVGPADVTPEERLLLLENRGFELLAARPALATGSRLERLAARHAVLKTCADLAAVLALEAGALPLGAPARVARARARLAAEPALAPLREAGIERLWERALAWRAGRVEEAADAADEWRAAAGAWTAAWRHAAGIAPGLPAAEAEAGVAAFAARAPWRRRWRLALRPEEGTAPAPLSERLRFAVAGTPQHRLNAAAAVVLAAAAASGPGTPRLDPGAARLLRRLGFGPLGGSWEIARAGLVARWRAWVLGRPEGAP